MEAEQAVLDQTPCLRVPSKVLQHTGQLGTKLDLQVIMTFAELKPRQRLQPNID
jgi:hypothetical protein